MIQRGEKRILDQVRIGGGVCLSAARRTEKTALKWSVAKHWHFSGRLSINNYNLIQRIVYDLTALSREVVVIICSCSSASAAATAKTTATAAPAATAKVAASATAAPAMLQFPTL